MAPWSYTKDTQDAAVAFSKLVSLLPSSITKNASAFVPEISEKFTRRLPDTTQHVTIWSSSSQPYAVYVAEVS